MSDISLLFLIIYPDLLTYHTRSIDNIHLHTWITYINGVNLINGAVEIH